MKRPLRLILVFTVSVLVPTSLWSQITFPKDTDLCQHEPWRLVFHDEFNGNTLDRSKWITYNPTWSNALADFHATPPPADNEAALHMIKVDDSRSFYNANNISVSEGACHITFKYQPQDAFGGSAQFTTGKLFHKYPFESGRFDIRCRIPRKGGIWAAFWMMGVNDCNAKEAGGRELDCFEYSPCETDLNKLSTTITGYKRFGCNGPEPSNAKNFEVEDIDQWHIFSTEWDRNFIRSYVDGQLRSTQSRFEHGDAEAACYPGQDLNNGHWVERTGVFPFYQPEHNQCLMAELKSTADLYTTNFMGICTPSLRSHDYINQHLSDRVWTIDYIRVYQRENNIQFNLRDLCPAITGSTIICTNTSQVYTYSVSNYSTIKDFKWMPGDGVQVLSTHDSSIEVVFTAYGNSSIGGTWSSAEEGCEERSFFLPIRIGAPAEPFPTLQTESIGNGFSNKLRVNNAAHNTTYTWSIYSNPSITIKTGTDVEYYSNYTPLQYTVTARNTCGQSTYSTGPFNIAAIEKEANQVYPNPARDALHLHLTADYFDNNTTVHLRVLNMYGRPVMDKSIPTPLPETTLDISNLPCGVYSLTINGSRKRIYTFSKI